jgi:hypothetical protein
MFQCSSFLPHLSRDIEGIIYLTKDDAEFDATYGHGDKAWF